MLRFRKGTVFVQKRTSIAKPKVVTIQRAPRKMRSFQLEARTSGQPTHMRRRSCFCSDCGPVSQFQQRQNAQYPETLVKHHIKRKRKRRQRRHNVSRQQSASIHLIKPKLEAAERTEPEKAQLQRRKERKSKTYLGAKQQFDLQTRKLLTKDDSSIGYEFFFENEKRRAEQMVRSQDASESEESQVDAGSVKQVSVKLIVASKDVLIRKKKSIHSRKTTEGIIQVNNLNLNKTLERYLSEGLLPLSQRHTTHLPSLTTTCQSYQKAESSSRKHVLERKLRERKSILKRNLVF